MKKCLVISMLVYNKRIMQSSKLTESLNALFDLNFGIWLLEFICYLVLVILDFRTESVSGLGREICVYI